MNQISTSHQDLLRPGVNCHAAETASHFSMLVDCSTYYKALHSAICKARHSIFVLGWDIDSRIELLRGDDADACGKPCTFFDLIQMKARENPQLMIYLNRWEFSLLFASQREGLSNPKWRILSPVNVHYCFDSLLPVSACHHQKIIVIDDEIVFCGGMDVAIARWDQRDHLPGDTLRKDPGGMNHLIRKVPFGPYHDVQCVSSGPIVRPLAEWCRERWRRVAGFEPIPLRQTDTQALPQSWPSNTEPQLENIPVGIAMTMPPLFGQPAVRQIERLYIDMIKKAEHFIYIENQYLTCTVIAEALNAQLRTRPGLRVLMASCFESNGLIERKSMWTGRVRFRDIVESGGVSSRVSIVYPVSGTTKQVDVRIHSKVMIVDDVYLRVGSSNLNKRSMGFDTECDLVMIGTDEKSRRMIETIRNDLIREHTGREMDNIEKLIRNESDIGTFLNYIGSSTQHFRRVDDERFRNEKLADACIKFGDPDTPFIPAEWTLTYQYAGTRRNLPRRLIFSALLIFLMLAAGLFVEDAGIGNLRDGMEFAGNLQNSSAGIAIFLTAFTVASLFISFTFLVIISAALLGLGHGIMAALAGIACGSIAGYLAGRLLNLRTLRALMGTDTEQFAQFVRNTGWAGAVFIRMVPIGLSSLINMALGHARMPFGRYMGGTLLGLLPPLIPLCLIGDAFAAYLGHPDGGNAGYLLAGTFLWLVVLAVTHFIVRRWQEKNFVGGYIQ